MFEKWPQWLCGLAGALTLAYFHDDLCVKRRVALGLCGWMTSAALTPWVCDYLGNTNPHAMGAIAFALGLLGMSVSRSLIRHGEQISEGVVKRILHTIFGPSE